MTLFALAQVALWVMGWFRSPEEVATYGVAIRTAALIALPLTIVNAVLPPLVAEFFVLKRRRDLEHTLRTMATVAVLVLAALLHQVFSCGKNLES